MARYYIRQEYKGTLSTIYFDVQRRTPKLKMRVSTHIQVEAKVWNTANRSVSAWKRFTSTQEGKAVADKLELIQQATNELISAGKITSNEDKHVIDDAICMIVYAETIQMEQERQKQEQERREQERKSIIGFYDHFITGIQNGTIRHGNNKRYAKASIVSWLSFGNHLYSFCDTSTTFDDVNKMFADKFCAHLEKQGMLPLTCNKYIVCFRKLCNLSAEYGVNHNATSLKVWKERTITEDEKRTEIYLTDEELTAIYQFPLHGVEEQARDLFMLGCLSCQRYSDYGTLTRANFGTTANGISVIKVRQTKTGTYVEIPITDYRIEELCRKYDYDFPRITERRINDHIQAFMQRVADTAPTLKEKYTTILTYQERRKEQHFASLLADAKAGKKPQGEQRRMFAQMKAYAFKHNGKPLYERNERGQAVKYKYELVTTHTARRSGITNLYKTGLLDTREMMSVSGHQSERIFENYIRVGTSEHAERIASKLKQIAKGKEAI